MLWTLWRAILVEFWRLLLLSTGVLVTVVAFAATVKPLADGKLTADQAIRFMVYAIPPMLAYALPFAGGFAATLAYHRFETDNEITAAKAGGIPYGRILFPAILSGAMLAGGLWALNDRVIPVFLTRMQEMITRDFAGLMVTSLSQGESAKIGKTEIHADDVREMPVEDGSPVEQQFLLSGVAMVETDTEGHIVIDGTSKRAWIFLLPVWALGPEDRARIGDDNATAVLMKFVDVSIYRDGAPQSAEELIAPAIPIPSVFEDDPKYASGSELKRIKDDPDSMSFVDRWRVMLARSIAASETLRTFQKDLISGSPVVLSTPDGGAIRILGGAIGAPSESWVISPVRETGLIEIEVEPGAGRRDRLRATSAMLTMQRPAEKDPLADQSMGNKSRFRLTLDGVTVLGTDAAGSTEMATTSYGDLTPDVDPLPGLLELNSAALLEMGEPLAAAQPESFLGVTMRGLRREIDFLKREVLSKQHERMAMSAQCLVMVLFGAVMALRLSNSTPLVVYLWSFFPALLSVIVLESGQQMVHQRGVAGLPLIWSAILGLAILTFIAYRGLARR
jgi:lipopolysaccharide export LptBFGC system permease protein LptF